MHNSRKQEFAVGAFVIAGLIAAIYLTLTLGGKPWSGADSYTIRARFNDVTGLREGSAIRVSGVKVGSVSKLELDRENFTVWAYMDIPNWLILDDDSIASVKTDGLIGDKYLSVQPGGSGFPIEPGGDLFETESAVDLEGLIKNFAFGSVED
ncbi:MAG: outer membrane lipid asymmetry maintenance protein MlaD [Opitutales bacterium]